MLTDQWQGFGGLPDYTDPSNIPTFLKDLFDFLGARAVPRYASIAERDAELSSPVNGQLCWVTADNAVYVRSGGEWRVLWRASLQLTTAPLGGVSGSLTSISADIERVYGTVSFYVSLQPGSVASGATIGTIPDGFKPRSRRAIPLVTGSSSTYNAFLQIETTGVVSMYHYNSPPASGYFRGTGSWAAA
ncbi:hypothetical protein [Isoptericola sp. QY 916]|uniref:hypothetical protein n=1 Tax=Isoptericola sp. QY 916 TaxID=2782570 RepID=UPI003D2FF86E|nr:hypothetical protein [Isoptericola sp. QY 916]